MDSSRRRGPFPKREKKKKKRKNGKLLEKENEDEKSGVKRV